MEYSNQFIANLDEMDDPCTIEFSGSHSGWPFRGFLVHWQGKVHAYANTCPHAGHALNLFDNRFFNKDQTFLICSSHGALFQPETGLCVAGPCLGKRLSPLICQIENNKVYVTTPNTVEKER
ncbi:MAG: Rieske 2Fe-2S domain-containing protein [Pseudomonadota bacterium]|nr:Rieske 2Fe-2S domain-containing protein [Pseudomonadota bacterium]